MSPTCDTAGVLGPIVTTVAAHQCAEAIKLMTGNIDALDRSMLSIDLWRNEHRRFELGGPTPDCPCCGQRRFESLDGRGASRATSLCGRNAVQVMPESRTSGPDNGALDLPALAQRLAPHGAFAATEAWLRGRFTAERGGGGEPIELTLFPDGRAIIRGTDRPDLARSIYSKYIGS